MANVDIIPRTIVEVCKEQDAHPFIIPAMGRHGGANVEGQKELLSGYGITDKAMGCPVWTTMETVLLGYSEYGRPVYQNKYAHEADGIIISCRIKPHNAVRGPYKSGVCKKMVVAERSNLLSAIPSIENAYDETAIIEAIPTQPIFAREPELLKIAAANMPSILVREADVLIVDAMEKTTADRCGPQHRRDLVHGIWLRRAKGEADLFPGSDRLFPRQCQWHGISRYHHGTDI